ncbi:MAG: septum formation initiator family protein [Desulfofustis sp.]|jgi:cell division protein FtsB
MALIRKKPKKKLTQLQENRLLKVVIVLIALAVLWLLFAPGTGVYSLVKMRSRTAALEQQTEALIKTNEELRAEIDRLKNDEAYLEQVAREKYGLLKKNERVFDFSRKSKND